MRGAFVCSLIASFITNLVMLVLFLRNSAPETLAVVLDRPGWQLGGGAISTVIIVAILVFASLVIADYVVQGDSFLLQIALSLLLAAVGSIMLHLSWVNMAARAEAIQDPIGFIIGAAMLPTITTFLASLLYFERMRKRIIA